jgi:hypothetical protein
MAVGILLITHPGIGPALIAVATRLLRQLPLKTEAFEVSFDADPESLLPAASAALRRVDEGQGVLVLTDLYGATPSNLAAQLARLGGSRSAPPGTGLTSRHATGAASGLSPGSVKFGRWPSASSSSPILASARR